MIVKSIKNLLIAGLVCLNISAYAVSNNDALAGLAYEKQWLSLGHYSYRKLSGRWVSRMDEDSFFLAADGKKNAQSELKSSVEKLLSDEANALDLQCRFPLRFTWLSQKIRGVTPDLAHCKSLMDWLNEIDAERVSVVFPTAYLDSPSSMFGHTLLRLDKSNRRDKTKYLSFAVSYAAMKTEEDSELAFVYRGLVGGYPGDLAIAPYFHKIKEYSEIESRDIWEYQLNLTPEEVKRLLLHLWEIKDAKLDYYFFTENCSFHVMAVLNVVRPENDLTDQDVFYTIPVATVRTLYREGLVQHVKFRPSVVRTFREQASHLTQSDKILVKKLVEEDNFDFGTHQFLDPNIASIAYQYSRLVPDNSGNASSRSLQLLKLVNRLPANTLEKVKSPAIRDDEGHESERITLAYGVLDDDQYIDLELRPAYHELVDPSVGYPLGSELVFSSGALRAYHEGDVKLDHYTLIGIQSIKSRDLFFSPVSWRVGIGATRNTNSSDRRLSPNLFGRMGYGYSLTSNSIAYGLGGGELHVQKGLEKGYDVLGQIELGFIYRDNSNKQQMRFGVITSESLVSSVEALTSLQGTYVFNLLDDVSIKIQHRRNRRLADYFYDTSVGVDIFF